MKSISIPEEVESIEDYAFYDCSSLKSISIPSSVTSIKYNAFYNCEELAYIFYDGTEVDWNNITKLGGNEALSNATLITSNIVDGASLALDGTLQVNIKFKSNADDDLEDWTINDSAVSVGLDGYATIDVAPKDYNEKIVIKCDDMIVKTFSVADMIYKYKNIDATAEIAFTLEAYCSAAETYFAGNTVANYSNSWDEVISSIAPNDVSMGNHYYGSSLVLESGTILRHYYTEAFKNFQGQKYGMYYKEQTIPAHMYAKESVGEGTYCVNDYIYRALTNPSSTANLKNLCVTLYYYGVAAEEYSRI